MSYPIKIYMAGLYTFGGMPGQTQNRKFADNEKEIVATIEHQLESYHYVGKRARMLEIRANPQKIFLDSGAYSAVTLGAAIDINAYCDFAEKNKDLLVFDDGEPLVAVLDAIGDAQKTYENQLAMEARGVRPLPCFHAGEDVRYLEHYIANYKYIALGGMVGSGVKQLQIWLDYVWDKFLLDGSGNPRIKVHGFGITGVKIMKRYPWYSCDSSSWVQTAAYGGISDETFGTLTISSKSPSRRDEGKHYRTLSPLERAAVDKIIAKKGFDLTRLEETLHSRIAFNLLYYRAVQDEINSHKKDNEHPQLVRGLF